MRSFRIKYITCLFTILLCPLIGVTQSETRPLQVRTLALDSKPIKGLFLETSSGHEELSFSVYQPSSIFSGRAADSLPIYQQQTNEVGEVEFVLFKQIALPTGAQRILLLGLHSSAEVGLVAIQDNFGAGDSQDWLLINASSKPLAFQVGADLDPVPVPPQESVSMRVKVPAGKGAAVKVAARFDGGWKKFYSTFWPIYENQRCLVLFVPDGDSVRVKNFFEVVDASSAVATD